MKSPLLVQVRRCPVCKTTVHWGKKIGKCKCPGRNWPKVVLSKSLPAA